MVVIRPTLYLKDVYPSDSRLIQAFDWKIIYRQFKEKRQGWIADDDGHASGYAKL